MSNMINIGTFRQTSTNPFSFDWDIDDYFRRSQKADRFFESPLFAFGGAVWRLQLFPNGDKQAKTVGSVELFFSKQQSFEEVHDISCAVGIKDKNGVVFSYKKLSIHFNGCSVIDGTKIIEKSSLESSKSCLVPKNILKVFVHDLVLTNKQNTYLDCTPQILKVDKAVSTDEVLPVESSTSEELTTDKKGIEILSENLKGLFLSEEGCDVTFDVKNIEVRAHRSVLIARSPVLASMFRHEMSETISGIVKIPDCSPGAFKALLLYLYSGTVENMSTDIVYDLYEAAVKYDVEYLKNKCVKFMKDDMSVETFCDTILLCQKYNEFELLQHGTNYFTEHALDILLTLKWQSFMKEDPITANELFIKQCKRNKC